MIKFRDNSDESDNPNSKLNEEKVKLMTKITIFEKNAEKEDMNVGKYYMEDYVKYHLLTTILTTTFCYLVFLGMYVLIYSNELLDEINSLDYVKILKGVFTGYIEVLIIFMVFAFIVYTIKYYFVKGRLIEYNRNLLRFLKLDRKIAQESRKKAKVRSKEEEDFDNDFAGHDKWQDE